MRPADRVGRLSLTPCPQKPTPTIPPTAGRGSRRRKLRPNRGKAETPAPRGRRLGSHAREAAPRRSCNGEETTLGQLPSGALPRPNTDGSWTQPQNGPGSEGGAAPVNAALVEVVASQTLDLRTRRRGDKFTPPIFRKTVQLDPAAKPHAHASFQEETTTASPSKLVQRCA